MALSAALETVAHLRLNVVAAREDKHAAWVLSCYTDDPRIPSSPRRLKRNPRFFHLMDTATLILTIRIKRRLKETPCHSCERQ